MASTSHILRSRRYASTNTGGAAVVGGGAPQVIYSNADLQKLQIISENKGKGGVYR